jgi:hypothetical protein
MKVKRISRARINDTGPTLLPQVQLGEVHGTLLNASTLLRTESICSGLLVLCR